MTREGDASAKARPRASARRRRQQITRFSYEPRQPRGTPTPMLIANTYILGVLGTAALLGIAALVHKHTRRHRDVAERSTNHAS
jgi:hypothetical protein